MLLINEILISEEIFDEFFVCNLTACKGACCVEGDYGAPLIEEEKNILENLYTKIEPYLNDAGKKAIEEQGKYVFVGKEVATTLVDNQECAYAIFEDGIAKCGIEKAWKDGAIDFQKPISCHLYPIRLSKLDSYIAINYSEWDICSAACSYGESLKVPVFQFLKDPIIRKFGEEFYNLLEEYYKQRN